MTKHWTCRLTPATWLLLAALGFLLLVPAQLRAAELGRTGTVEQLSQDDGFIIISGRRLGYSDELTQVFLEDRQIGAQKLDAGMVVNYTVNADGVIVRMVLLGPADKLQMLDRH